MRDRARIEIRIPLFLGEIDYDAYMDWEEEIEFIFRYYHCTEEKKVRKITSAFRGYAITWWEQTTTTRRYNGEPQISSWFEMKIEMKKRFASSPYSRDVHRGLRRRSPGSKGDNEQSPSTPPQQIPTRRKRDIRPLNQAYQPNQEELSHDSTFSRNLTQAGISEKKNRLKIIRHEEDMQLTSWRTCMDPSVAIFGSKGVNNNLIKKVAASHPSFISKELDLRSNPVKGGEDGVILESLNSRDKEPSIQQISPEGEGDIRPVNRAYLPNQEELSHNSTCSRNLTQKGVTEKKNGFKSLLHVEDIQLPIRHTSSEPGRDQRMLKEEFQSNRDEPSCEPTCFGKLTHQRSTENWNHVKIHYGLEVIQFLNQEIPGCPYLEAHGFGQLQNQFWRPGEPYNQQSEALESLYKLRTRIWLKRKMQWALGKVHESNGSEEESKAREAKPPDGLGKESHAYEAKLIYTSHTVQEEYIQGPMTSLNVKAQQKVKKGEAQFVWARGEEEETWLQEPKSKKRPFHIWCWTCTRKRDLEKAQEKAQFVGYK